MPDEVAPLVCAEVDLTSLDGFLLNTERLLGSELVALSSGDEFKAAVLLWCRSWKQIPACSLPDDDKVLASFAGNLSPAKWQRIKPMALRGFVKCNDGRLYHKTLSQEAPRAWDAHVKYERNREADRARLKRWRESKEQKDPFHDETDDETGFKDVSKPSGNADETSKKRSEAKRSEASRYPAIQPSIANPLPLQAESTVFQEPAGSEGSGSARGNGKWRDQGQRDGYAANLCLPYLPGRDDAERWEMVMAAEDPSDPRYDEACRLMRAAAKRAKVGWKSPHLREGRGGA